VIAGTAAIAAGPTRLATGSATTTTAADAGTTTTGVVEANDYLVYRAGAGVIIGLTQNLGFGLHYSYFRYRFDNMQELSQTLSNPAFSRQTLRASLDLFAPLFNRSRRP
jgi:opacity protein-like surface antigen